MKTRGFTLIELLVAITITVVMTGIVIVITTESLGFWNRAQSQSTTLAQAQLALDQLEHDLEGTIQRHVGEPWIRVVQNDSLVALENRGWQMPDNVLVKPDTNPNNQTFSGDQILLQSFGRGGSWLRFFTTDISSSGGRPVAVSYQITRRVAGGADANANPQSIRYLLMRSEMNQPASLGIMNVQFNADNILQTPTASDVLALNVVDFGIWFYNRNSNGVRQRIPSSGLLAYDLPENDAIPTEADVMVRVLSDKGATLISNIENKLIDQRPPEFASYEEWWWSIVEANSQVYVRHINLLNRPL